MGIKASTLVPRYFKNFNIDQRVKKQIETIEKAGSLAPRHPTTAHIFKKIEETTPDIDEKQINKFVIEKTKEVKVFTNEATSQKAQHEVADKRPKKENELNRWIMEKKEDIDFDKYGYTKPEKIKPGNLTLRQFDELINEYRSNKSIETINNLTKKYNLDSTNLHVLLEYYKPLYRIAKNTKNEEQADALVGNVFPNIGLKSIESKSK